MAQYFEKEIFSEVELCDENGKLNENAIGWSRKPLHNCNLKGKFLRKKRWNYWCITTQQFAFSVCIADVDYLGLASAYFINFNKKEILEQTIVIPFGIGFSMPPIVDASVKFKHKKINLNFKCYNGGIEILAKSKHFQGKRLNAEIFVYKPENHETLNVVIPWSKSKFQFTSKQNCLPAEGTITIGGESHTLNRQDSFACLDYGRGIWPYKTAWNWASAAGWQNQNKVLIGLQFGGKWTDGTGMNENGICLNGKLFKISEDMDFSYDRKNFMKQWTIKTKISDTVNLFFKPFFERVSRTNLIFLYTEVHQLFGHFFGQVKVEDKYIEIKDLIGWVEEQVALW